MLHVASVCTSCCMLLRVVGSCCAKFKTGQTFSYLQTSLRSKRFQSSYCAQVRAGAKKKGGRGRRRGVIPLPLPRHSFFCSRPNFLDELARKRLLRRLLANERNSWVLLAKNVASVCTGLNTELSFLYQITTTNKSKFKQLELLPN